MKMLQAALVATMALVSTAAVAQPLPPPPPPPQVEVGVFPPPGPPELYGLEPGHWHWNGYRYVWIRRHWVLRGAGFTHWVPGHWAVGPRGNAGWIPGHWAA